MQYSVGVISAGTATSSRLFGDFRGLGADRSSKWWPDFQAVFAVSTVTMIPSKLVSDLAASHELVVC